jgi:hypothetical protein
LLYAPSGYFSFQNGMKKAPPPVVPDAGLAGLLMALPNGLHLVR